MITNWVANKKMKNLLEQVFKDLGTEELRLNVNQLKILFQPCFKKVKDCVIIAEESVEELEKGFDNAVKMYTDKTGYEASNTETRINCYFENEISMMTGTQIALMVIEVWALKLKQMEPDSKFCLIMCSNEERVEIRFHKVRNDERLLADDIESYKSGAIGYVVV